MDVIAFPKNKIAPVTSLQRLKTKVKAKVIQLIEAKKQLTKAINELKNHERRQTLRLVKDEGSDKS